MDDRLVVVRARVHAEHHEAAPGELSCADHIHKVRCAMDGEKGHRWSRSAVGRIEGALRCRWSKLYVAWVALSKCRSRPQSQGQSDDYANGFHHRLCILKFEEDVERTISSEKRFARWLHRGL